MNIKTTWPIGSKVVMNLSDSDEPIPGQVIGYWSKDFVEVETENGSIYHARENELEFKETSVASKDQQVINEILATANDVNSYLESDVPIELYQSDINRKFELLIERVKKIFAG